MLLCVSPTDCELLKGTSPTLGPSPRYLPRRAPREMCIEPKNTFTTLSQVSTFPVPKAAETALACGVSRSYHNCVVNTNLKHNTSRSAEGLGSKQYGVQSSRAPADPAARTQSLLCQHSPLLEKPPTLIRASAETLCHAAEPLP